jgi:hypothetical protein
MGKKTLGNFCSKNNIIFYKGSNEMDFAEEQTPSGLRLKIIFKNWQFLAYDKKGQSIYADSEDKKLIHKVPYILCVGINFKIKKIYDKEYYLLKIRDNNLIIPYIDLTDKITKYLLVPIEKNIDLIPAIIFHVDNIPNMIKDFDPSIIPDIVIIDKTININDETLLKNRFKLEEIIHVEFFNNYTLNETIEIEGESDSSTNLNILSENPVFLAQVHLRNLELSKVNQLLLDFELSVFDTEYILKFIEDLISKKDNENIKKNMPMLLNLNDSFRFYMYLLQKDDIKLRKMISEQTDLNSLAPFRTLISKVKSIFTESDDQLLLTDYENLVLDKKEELKNL